MRSTKPIYFDKFKCIAGKCKDSCCIGWDIYIDDDTYQKYLSLRDSFADIIRSSIAKDEEGYHFILDKKTMRCPFLNSDNLCDIIINYGEDYLCEICREHPRFYTCSGNDIDMGISLCCEEACRMVFENPKPIKFITEGKYTAKDTLHKIRDKVIASLQNRKMNLYDRIKNIFKICSISEFASLNFDTAFEDAFSLTPIDENWIKWCGYLKKEKKRLLNHSDKFNKYIYDRSYEYEHIAVYIVFRYFAEPLNYGDFFGKLKLLTRYLALQYTLDLTIYVETGEFTFNDRIQTTKYLSKELEYDPCNIDTLIFF